MWRRPGGIWRRKTRTFLTNKLEEEHMHVRTQQFNTPDEDYFSIQLDSGEI